MSDERSQAIEALRKVADELERDGGMTGEITVELSRIRSPSREAIDQWVKATYYAEPQPHEQTTTLHLTVGFDGGKADDHAALVVER